MQGTINISEFMAHLADNDLVIAPRKMVKGKTKLTTAELESLRHRYMKRTALKISEILEARLLPLTSPQGVKHWIDQGKIQQSEVLRPKTPNGALKILTIAIKRLGYAD